MHIITFLRKYRQSQSWQRRVKYFLLGAALAAIVLPVGIIGGYGLIYRDKAYPGVKVAGEPVDGMTTESLRMALNRRIEAYQAGWPKRLAYETHSWLIPYPASDLEYRVEATIHEALTYGRRGSMIERVLAWKQLRQAPVDVPLSVNLSDKWLTGLAATVAGTLAKEAVPATLTVLPEGKAGNGSRIVASPGEAGQEFRGETFKLAVQHAVATLTFPPVAEFVHVQPQEVTPEQVTVAQTRAERLLKRELTVSAGPEEAAETWKLSGTDLVAFIRIQGGYDRDKLITYLTPVAEGINHPPVNAKFQFDDQTQKVVEFLPAKPGVQVDIAASVDSLETRLLDLETEAATEPAQLVTIRQEPEISLDRVNDMGIKELIGHGESTFFHSIPTRVHNVALAASRINGTLVKPGETFSFNQAVGEVAAATGYQQAYIIRNGRTELGDGGGVCQDSTTVFRAALNAGLPIVERHAHAYRVGYYEQNTKAGIDATVYAPSVDLKFVNDTPSYILLQTVVDVPNRHLTVNIYGTGDGRKSEIKNHSVWGITPPPPDVFVDDPTLPAGQTKQIDFQAWGAKSKFDYVVKRGDEILIEKTFTSVYKPWAAVYLRGTK